MKKPFWFALQEAHRYAFFIVAQDAGAISAMDHDRKQATVNDARASRDARAFASRRARAQADRLS